MTGKIHGALDRCRDQFIKNSVAGERCNITVENFEGSTSKKKVALGYRTFAGKFCIANKEFSDLQCLMNTPEVVAYGRWLHMEVQLYLSIIHIHKHASHAT